MLFLHIGPNGDIGDIANTERSLRITILYEIIIHKGFLQIAVQHTTSILEKEEVLWIVKPIITLFDGKVACFSTNKHRKYKL